MVRAPALTWVELTHRKFRIGYTHESGADPYV